MEYKFKNYEKKELLRNHIKVGGADDKGNRIDVTNLYFEKNGNPETKAIIGISGGKDSSVVAALCCAALGKERVIGVMMPNGVQSDIKDSEKIIDFLGIKGLVVNIQYAYMNLVNQINEKNISSQAQINMPPRLRMTVLYGVAQNIGGRVVNTCNLSEDWVGYSTRYGDSVGDFSPLSRLTVAEVKEIGHLLGLPAELVEKTPIDGLCGKTDEDNLGFTYAELDRYIRTGEIEDADKKALIDRKHKANLFKLELMPCFEPDLT